jgi:hypothetical protein
MGNNNSIEIEEKSNGIFQVIVKDIPDYPISYLRLCWNFDKKKYCIAEDCDSEDKYLKRKILVVGMNLPGMDKIYEQSFYLSSGLNSIESLEKFFQKELIKDNEGTDADIWIPFSGFGYPNDVEDYNSDIKLLKTFFDCSERGSNCLYGRFGNKEPNLMQISYCLGGKFWENNVDTINDLGFNIRKLPSISSFFRSKIPCIFSYKKWSNIECSIYLNKYIASALPYNYSANLLLYKNKLLRFYKANKYFDWKDIKFDYRLIYILKEKGMINFSSLQAKAKGKAELPYERSFTENYWTVYLQHLNKLYTDENKFFIDNIVPIINEMIPIFPDKPEKILKEDLTYVIEEEVPDKKIEKEIVISDIKQGTYENPYDKRENAGIGEYYRKGKQVVKKNK